MTETATPLKTLDDLDDLVGERFVFDDADWAFYELILKRVGDRHIFVTFDGERLEVMSPSPEHERHTSRLDKLLWILAEELDVPLESMGSFTLKKRNVKRGLEPDRCYYTRNADAVRGKRRIDLQKDPPPDLAVEIEVSRRLLDRIGIYRELRVPEVWCYDGSRLRVLRLGRTGYKEADRSPTFPNLPLAEVHRLLTAAWETAEHTWTRNVRAWVRHNLPSR
ncbi:MAG TPA: Uma2 family endonuclease [Tepidisphaeraceae bacterium]|nr:Uma2 family endonuclease [Tepidisphaeraceae bacterium]